MAKIPVGRTIAHAYRFAFGNGLTMLRAIALPMLAQLAVIFLITRRAALFMAAVQSHDPSAASLLGPLLLLLILGAIFFFAQFAAATETALGHPPQSWISYPFGKPMWRLLGGFLAALAAVAAFGLVALLVLWLIALGLDVVLKVAPGSRPAVAIFAGVLVAGFSCSLLYASIRFLFLLAPINVSEQQLGVARAWKLSGGNFWRALLVLLAIALPVMIVNYGYSFAMAGPLHVPPGASKEALQAAEAAWRVDELNAMADHWYFTLPLTAVLVLFQFGAGCAAQVFAYRVLTEGEPSGPIA